MPAWSKKKIRRLMLILLLDVLSVMLAAFGALFLRFELSIPEVPERFVDNLVAILPFYIPMVILIFALFRMYASLWKYAGLEEAISGFTACLCAGGAYALLCILSGYIQPRSCYFFNLFLLLTLTLGERFSYRVLRRFRHKFSADGERNILLVGAGSAGSMLLRELNLSADESGARVVCIIDDDKRKWGNYLSGVRVVGGKESLVEAVEKYKVREIIFAIPSASAAVRRQYLEDCKELGCVLKLVPDLYQLINGQARLSDVRRVELADLLGRPETSFAPETVKGYVGGRTVLVTGAGGSIGSELCRQLAALEPGRLILLDIYENSLYYLALELGRRWPKLELVTLVGSVRDEGRMEQVFETYRPEVVYHAAAHKHVPLMEDSPQEAVKNNVFGTLNLARCAHNWGVRRFVLISTDKAVNPTNVMGATKRLCEMIVQLWDRRSDTEFVAVRFGNVLGSNGSVIPIFRRQIETGGPVTVTHPEITRYFMSISEAASLVLQAGALARGGEIFVLDMGEPVKILTLAENMIRLSNLTPYKDIQISFTGLRPGEKLYEELLMAEEGLMATASERIHVCQPLELDEAPFLARLEELRACAEADGDVRPLLHALVPTFHEGENL